MTTSKRKQKAYLLRAVRKYGRLKLLFGYSSQQYSVARILSKSGMCKYKYRFDYGYVISCFLDDYAFDYDLERYDWKRVSAKKTIDAMYKHDRYDDYPLLEIRAGKGFKKLLKGPR